eukprot:2618129-Prymnesium_polylepis.1
MVEADADVSEQQQVRPAPRVPPGTLALPAAPVMCVQRARQVAAAAAARLGGCTLGDGVAGDGRQETGCATVHWPRGRLLAGARAAA